MSADVSDLSLVRRVQRGDKGAFDALVLKYQHKVVKLVMRYVRNPAEAEDVAQEAFIKAYRALPSFRGESAFYTWLYRIAINTAKNHFAAQGRRTPTRSSGELEDAENFEDASGLRDVATPDAVLLSKQVGEAVNRAIDRLPEDLRTAIVLRELEGMSYDEIATAMNCPVGTVRSRIFRAREAVAAELRPLLGTREDQRW
jgi:RNA polymerase sigma-70 factor, ECF subfamily